MPKDMGTAILTHPRGWVALSVTSASTASPFARIRVARSSAWRLLSVRDMRREVRCSKALSSRPSRRAIAFETVAWASPSSAAAETNDPVSATLAKIAHASKSGDLIIAILESILFH